MKSETIKIGETTKCLPYPKLMVASCGETIILAESETSGYISGTVVSQCDWGIGFHSTTWNAGEFKDLPFNQVIQLSNN